MTSNTIPEGYKQSELGIIPIDWRIAHFEDVADIDHNNLKESTLKDYKFTYISLSGVNSDDFKIETTQQTFETAPSRARRIVKKGDILMSTVRPNLLGFSFIKNDIQNLIASTGFAVITCNHCSNKYLYHYLFSQNILKQLHQLIVGSNYPAINSSDVRKLKISLPPSSEQILIANLLGYLDKNINITNQLKSKKEHQKKWLMQQLLTGKKRVKGLESAWNIKTMSDCVKCVSREVKKPSSSFFGLGIRSHGKGIFHKNNFEPEDLAMDVLYEVKENDLIVNITFAWEHAIAIAGKGDDGGLVSHRFPTYTFNLKNALPEFFKHYILLKRFKFELDLISPGGAGRNRVMSKKDFLNIEVLIPDIEEQTAIAKVLQTSDKEIQLLKAKAAKLKEVKKGMMQVLLTGKKRLKPIEI
jgi:type I restriction enzyme S subunit